MKPAAALLVFLLSTLLLDGCRQDEVRPYVQGFNKQVQVSWDMEPFPWSMDFWGASPGLTTKPGATWRVEFQADVDLSRYEEKYGRFTHLIVAVQGEWRYAKDGTYRTGPTTYALSSNLTVAGMPIERFDGWPKLRLLHGKDGTPLEAVKEFKLDEVARTHRLRGRLQARLPADTPEGYYDPRVFVLARVEGVPYPVHLGRYGYGWDEWEPNALPMIKVGEPAKPYMPWSILSQIKYRGQAGTLPEEYRGKVAQASRAGFPARLILPPGRYMLTPNFPGIFPGSNMVPLDGGYQIVPDELPSFLRFETGGVTGSMEGPGGKQTFARRSFTGKHDIGPGLQGGGYQVDMTHMGDYTFKLNGTIQDAFGRERRGGGTYLVTIARPLTFSTSCKPGTSFLVGAIYPPKVNVLPPVPATVEVEVAFYPQSDAARRRVWRAKGKANRFGHFVPHGQAPLRFDQPGEYKSTVRATFSGHGGMLFRGEQTSTGVVAPERKEVELHGSRSFPWNVRHHEPLLGARKRFKNRQKISVAFMREAPYLMVDPFAPFNPQDTIFVPMNFSEENTVEPHISMTVHDPALYEKLARAYVEASFLLPAWTQPPDKPWVYLRDIVWVTTDSYGWFPLKPGPSDQLPVMPVGKDGWNPSAYPQKRRVQAYTIMGVVRPGFPVMTAIHQSEAIGMYWLAHPNRFGHHFNVGANGDLPGDVYRIQAGMVLQDLETGKNYYDAYGAAITVTEGDGELNSNSILAPGERPLVTTGGRDHFIFLATDTHDTLEQGEVMHFGGMVFPNVPGDVTWTVTKPSGQQIMVKGKANRVGTVGGSPPILADEPGIYRIKTRVTHGELTGDVVGTRDGSWWHAVVPADGKPLLRSTLPAMLPRVIPHQGVRIPLSWPANLRKVKINFAVLMPGQVLDQGEIKPRGQSWEYPFSPLELARQYPNFDARTYANGKWELADTVVFQFFLEAEDNGKPIFDSLRLFFRGGSH